MNFYTKYLLVLGLVVSCHAGTNAVNNLGLESGISNLVQKLKTSGTVRRPSPNILEYGFARQNINFNYHEKDGAPFFLDISYYFRGTNYFILNRFRDGPQLGREDSFIEGLSKDIKPNATTSQEELEKINQLYGEILKDIQVNSIISK